jgi:CHAT domain-containing protein
MREQIESRNPALLPTQLIVALVCSFCFLSGANVRHSYAFRSFDEDLVKRTAAAQSSIKLTVGQVLQQDILGGDVKRFTVELAAGESAQILVKWLGLDVDLAVITPGTGFSIPIRGVGPIPVSILSERAGDYAFEVRTLEQVQVRGSFEISCSSIHLATEEDRNRLEALRLISQGNSQKTRTAAVAVYLQALKRAQSSGDSFVEAYVLQKLANAYISNKDIRNAESTYAALIELRLKLNDRRSLAYTLREIGGDYRAYDSPTKAIGYFQRALSIAREINDRQAEATVLYSIGFAYARTGRMETALEFYEKALKIQQERHDRLNEARTLNAMGGAYNVLGDQTKALALYTEAAPIFRELQDPYREAIMLNNIGLANDDLGRWQEAKNYYLEAISKYEALLDKATTGCRAGSSSQTLSVCNSLATTSDNVGELYNTTGDPESALQTFNRTLEIWKILNQPQPIGSTLSRICYSHVLQGKLSDALKECNEALIFNRKAEDLRGTASTLTFLGMVYTGLNQPDDAMRSFEEALKLQRESGERRGEGITLNQFGLLYVSTNQPDKALARYEEALKLWRDTKDEDGETITLYNIARVERDRGNLESALNHIKQALQIIELRRTSLSSQKLSAAYFANKQNHFELEIDVQMLLAREKKSDAFFAEALVANEHARGRQLLDALAESRVLNATTQSRIMQNPELASAVNRKLELQMALRAKANSRTALLGRTHKPEELSVLNIEIAKLTDEYDQLEGKIRILNPSYASFVKPIPLTLRELQAELEPNTLLLEYALGEKRSYILAITNDSIKGFQLEARDKVEAVANRLVQALTARNRDLPKETFQQREQRVAIADREYSEAVLELSRMVIEPVASELGQKRLVIVADGALQYVPFSALPRPGSVTSSFGSTTAAASRSTTLIDAHEIVSLPSASVLALQRRELANRTPAPLRLAVIADPVFDVHDPRVSDALAGANRSRKTSKTSAAITQQPSETPAPLTKSKTQNSVLVSALREVGLNSDGTLRRLPQSRTEASAISQLVPPKEVLKALDFNASRTTALSGELAKYQYVHFATHGVLSLEHPELSGIALSMVDEKGRMQDGYLRLYEIYSLNLPAELVVLSACETGVGKQIRGEGLIALTRGFMYAGAKRVVASLWKVDDSATAALMAQFYKEMFSKGKRPSAALQAAQLEIAKQKRWQHPYYWAGFVLQGEWR